MLPGEIIDVSMRVYRSLGWTILKSTAVPTLLCVGGMAYLFDFVAPNFFLTSTPNDVSAQVWESLVSLASALFLAGPLFLTGLSYSSAVVVSLVSDYMVGNLPSPRAAAESARRSLRSMLVVSLYELLVGWSGVLAGIGLIMIGALAHSVAPPSSAWPAVFSLLGFLGALLGGCVMPFVLMRHALVPAATVLERLRPRSAARRSVELLRGSAWQPSGYGTLWMLLLILGFVFLMILAGVGASLGFVRVPEFQSFVEQYPIAGAIVAKSLDLLPSFFVVWTLVPAWCAAVTILYYERRIRLEGYDIDALAQDVWKSDKANRFQL